jgi:hypothetical protein
MCFPALPTHGSTSSSRSHHTMPHTSLYTQIGALSRCPTAAGSDVARAPVSPSITFSYSSRPLPPPQTQIGAFPAVLSRDQTPRAPAGALSIEQRSLRALGGVAGDRCVRTLPLQAVQFVVRRIACVMPFDPLMCVVVVVARACAQLTLRQADRV